jgi:DNA-binding SARP family transcriptional activator/predicted ATPase
MLTVASGNDRVDFGGLQIRLLGGLQLFVHDAPIKFAAPLKAAALLAYLIIKRSRTMPRDTIAFALWPDEDETKARANLRRHIALLQHILATSNPPAIVADQRSIRWNSDYDPIVDVCEFERLSAESDGATAAVALYGGDLLPAVYDDWMMAERERLRMLQSANLERLTEAYRRDGDYSSAIHTGRMLLEHDPWREDTVRRIMMLRYASGDRAGALQEYEQFSRRLHTDLHVSPMPETIACFEGIVRNAPVHPPTSKTPSAASSPDTVPFVGRTEELATLHACWLRAVRGQGRTAFVIGEAGIGKSRLAAEFARHVESQGGRVVSGGTISGEASPYEAIVRTLRGALPMIVALDLKPMWLAAAATVLPELRQNDDTVPRLSALEPEREQSRLFEAMWRCFDGLARIRPLLIVLEDLHWAGEATVAFLTYLVERLGTAPIVLLVTYRDDETGLSHPLRAFRRIMQREHGVASLPLGGLSLTDVESFIGRTSGIDARDGFSYRAHALSAGNPFFLGEILRDSQRTGSAEPVLPASLQIAIGDRVARLSENARSLLAVAATVGQTFASEIVSAASGFSEDQVLPCIDELLDARFARVSTGSAREGSCDFVFSHQLVQAYVYGTIPTETRKVLHRRIGVVMERMHHGRLDGVARELARHFDLGGRPARAADYYYASAQAAIAVHADEEALTSLSRAASLADATLQYSVIALRETVYARRGMREHQLADIVQLETLSNDLAESNLECLRRRIRYARAVDDISAQERAVERLKTAVVRSSDPYWSAFEAESAAVLMAALGDYPAALLEAECALSRYRALEDATGIVRTLCLIADSYGVQGLADPSTAAIADCLALAATSSNEALLIGTLDAASRSAYRNNNYERCSAFAEQGLVLCQAIGDREGEADAYFRLGNVASRRFAIDAATEYFAKATALYNAVDKPLGEAMVLVNGGVLFLKIGEFTRALESFRRSRRLFLRLKDLRGLTICAINLGMVAYLLDRFPTARRILRSALRPAEQLGAPILTCAALSNLGAAERELGDLPNALEHCERSMRLRREKAPSDMASDLADLGLTYLHAANIDAAVGIATEIGCLDDAALQSIMYPQHVLWSAAQMFAAAHLDDRYRVALERAVALRSARVAAFTSEAGRETYRALRFNREIEAAMAQSDGVRTGILRQ